MRARGHPEAFTAAREALKLTKCDHSLLGGGQGRHYSPHITGEETESQEVPPAQEWRGHDLKPQTLTPSFVCFPITPR